MFTAKLGKTRSGVDSGSQWKNWGGVLSNRGSSSEGEEAEIFLEKNIQESELKGTLKVVRNKSLNHGLLIEVQGFFKPCENKSDSSQIPSTLDQPNTWLLSNPTVIPTWYSGEKKSVTIVSPALAHYNFALQLPDDLIRSDNNVPLGKVVYLVRVYKEVDSIYSLLTEKSIKYLGLPRINSTGIVEEKICIGEMKMVLQLPKKTFAPNQNIPLTLKLFNPSQGYVKKITLVLWMLTKCIGEEGKEENDEDVAAPTLVSSVLASLTFNKFPKGESSRDGFFDMEKSIGDDESRNLKHKYLIQVNVATKNSETFSTQLNINVGDPDAKAESSSKMKLTNPSAPPSWLLDEDEEMRSPAKNKLTTPSAPDWAPSSPSKDSILVYPPPNYSVLSSRATSTLSLDTLPPHYEDVW